MVFKLSRPSKKSIQVKQQNYVLDITDKDQPYTTNEKQQDFVLDTNDSTGWLFKELLYYGGKMVIKNNKIVFDIKGTFVFDLDKGERTTTLWRVKKQ